MKELSYLVGIAMQKREGFVVAVGQVGQVGQWDSGGSYG